VAKSRSSPANAASKIAANRVPAKPGVPVVRSLERGVALLKAFTAARPRQTLTELARAAGLDAGTARRLLHTLQLGGLVEHDPDAGAYALAVGVLELASVVDRGRDLRETVAPFLSTIAEEAGATSFLWTYHDGMALCVDRVRAQAPHVDVSWFSVGARTALNCGGGPRALLAFLSEQERRDALSRPLPARTPASQTDPAALAREAEAIRRDGYALAIDDFFIGITGLGAPLMNRDGRLVGALSISGLTSLLVEDGRPRHLAILTRIAADIRPRLF
jgi:DNA-binding IclR family transcriptional regulator